MTPPTTIETGALATASGFAVGCVVVQGVLVPRWRSMSPEDYLADFRRLGPRTGAILFPLELAATALLARTALLSRRRSERGAQLWAAAAACEIGTVAMLGLYFARANAALLSAQATTERATVERERWQRWNAARAGLAITAAGLGAAAALRSSDEHRPSGDAG